ncbi:MAG: DUF3990 domain-containing protein [Clostridiales bacterium]|nr:DUF3990 domain-containing protein [Clostridiales bacterium]
MILYHGSNIEVKNPQILKSRKFLDFGVGFYLTSDYEQAKRWAVRTADRRKSGRATISVYDVDENDFKDLSVLTFESANKEWLRYISYYRTDISANDLYDIVKGPVANDQAIRTVNDYLKGRFTEDIAIQLLLPQKLKDQYAFKTEKAICVLKLTEVKHL